MEEVFQELPVFLIPLIVVLSIWESIWKAIALYKAGGNKDMAWFIFIFIFNTAGILPIIYVLTHRD
jgi:methionyl-tRNA synthetase